MFCPKCKIAMKEMKRSYHKKRKWVCPCCGRVTMQHIGSKVKGGGKKSAQAEH